MFAMGIKKKLIALTFIPLLGLSYLTLTKINDDRIFNQKLKDVQILVSVSKSISLMIHETQKERGMSAGFVGSKGKQFDTMLPQQRKLSDVKIEEFKKSLELIDKTHYPKEFNEEVENLLRDLGQLPQVRQSVSNLEKDVGWVVKKYTDMNTKMLDIAAYAAALSPENAMTKALVAYTAYLKSKERSGIERAVLSGTFGANAFAPGMYAKLITLIAEQNAYMDTFSDNATDKMRQLYKEAQNHPSFDSVEKMRTVAIEKGSEGNFGINAETWFKTITEKIDQLKKVDDLIAGEVDDILNSFQSNALFDALIGGFIVLFSLGIGSIIARDIEKRISSLRESILHVATSKDLTTQITNSTKDEFSAIYISFGEFIQSLSDVITKAQEGARQNVNAASNLNSAFEEISENITKEVQIITSNTAQANKLKHSLLGVSTEASQSRDEMISANQQLLHVRSLIEDTISQITQNSQNEIELANKLAHLSNDASQVKNVLEVIADIAEQTNLLALNAAIEAARAGEHGRGFAVVADEVRKLAEKTQKSLIEINATINVVVQGIIDASGEMNEGTRRVEALVSQTDQVQNEVNIVGDSMDKAAQSIMQTTKAMNESAQAMDAFSNKLKEVEEISASNSQSIKSSGSHTQKLALLADELIGMLSQFRVS